MTIPVSYSLIASLYAKHDIKPMTRQQEQFVLTYFRQGCNFRSTIRMLGLTMEQGQRIMANESVSIVLDDLMSVEQQNELMVSKDMLNHMLMQAWDSTQDATEQVKVVHELAVINDLIPSSKRSVQGLTIVNQVNGQGGTLTTLDGRKQQLTDEDLVQLAGSRFAQALGLKPTAPPEDLSYNSELDIFEPRFQP
jgi:hypothetical protein